MGLPFSVVSLTGCHTIKQNLLSLHGNLAIARLLSLLWNFMFISHLQACILSSLSMLRICPCCNFATALMDLKFTISLSLFTPLGSYSLPLRPQGFLSLGRMGVVYIFHLRLSIPRSHFLYLGHLWFSGLIAIYYKNMFL